MYIRWLIFSWDLLSLYPAVHFLSMWLSGIVAIINSNSNCGTPWNITLWIFASAKLFPPANNSTLPIFTVFSIKFVTSSDILNIWSSLLSTLRDDIILLLLLLLSLLLLLLFLYPKRIFHIIFNWIFFRWSLRDTQFGADLQDIFKYTSQL